MPEFSQYSGQQQNWPTQPGSFVNTQFGLPIYIHSYPSRPYNVLGYLETLETPVWVRYAVGKAKALKADAMIVSEGGYAGSISSATRTQTPMCIRRIQCEHDWRKLFEGADESRVHSDQMALG